MLIAEAVVILQALDTKYPGQRLSIETLKGSWWRFGFRVVRDNQDGTLSTVDTWEPDRWEPPSEED